MESRALSLNLYPRLVTRLSYPMLFRKNNRSDAEKLHYRIIVTGRVQGVGFRWGAANEAIHLGLKGYVKNMSDGSVYIEAEGDREKLDEFIEWCRTGPRYGYVESVDFGTLPPVHFKEFRIEH